MFVFIVIYGKNRIQLKGSFT